MTALGVRNLHKRYGRHVAVDDISFTVEERELFGIIRPNGAGKTTTVESIAGLRPRAATRSVCTCVGSSAFPRSHAGSGPGAPAAGRVAPRDDSGRRAGRQAVVADESGRAGAVDEPTTGRTAWWRTQPSARVPSRVEPNCGDHAAALDVMRALRPRQGGRAALDLRWVPPWTPRADHGHGRCGGTCTALQHFAVRRHRSPP